MSKDIIIDDKEKVDSILWFLYQMNQGFKKIFESSGYYYFIDDNKVIAVDEDQITPVVSAIPYESKYKRKDDFMEFFKDKLIMMRTFNEDEHKNKLSFFDFYSKKNDDGTRRKDIMSKIVYNHDKGLFRVETSANNIYETKVNKEWYKEDIALMTEVESSINTASSIECPIDYDMFSVMKDMRDGAELFINIDSEIVSFKKPIDKNHIVAKFNYKYFCKFTKKGKGNIKLHFTNPDNDIYTIEIEIEIRNRYKYRQLFNIVDF